MPHQVDTDSIGFLVGDVSRLFRAEFDRRLAHSGLGITGAEARVLVNAARAGAVRQNVLADLLGVEAMTLSSVLDRLEARGLIRRAGDPTDRRAKLVELTNDADHALVCIATVSRGVREECSLGVPADEWRKMIETLKHMQANLAGAKLQPVAETDAA